MEKHVNQKLEQYQVKFKTDIKEWLMTNNISMINSCAAQHASSSELLNSKFLQYIYDYNNLQINESDLKKRKRIKNVVPQFELCIAKRANGEQCTRRKKACDKDLCALAEPVHFCGTHIKGIPHGIVENDIEIPKLNTKVEVWVKDIKGINYYIDATHNVYKPEDILTNKINPAVIAKWSKNIDDVYSIPQFGI